MSQQGPLVSIVVPVYNAEKYVRETLVSLLNQTYSNLEIFAIDDGSKDRSLEIMHEYKDRIQCLSKKNSGQADTLNQGWKLSKGVYVGYLSADDVFYPNAIEKLVEAFAKYPQASAVYCDYNLIDSSSAVIKVFHSPEFDRLQLVENLVCQPGPGALFRRSSVDRLGGWNPELRQMPDFEFWLRLSSEGPLKRIPEILAGFRIHEESQTFKIMAVQNAEEPVKVMKEFLNSPYSQGLSETSKIKGLAFAYFLSGQWHLRARRWSTSFYRYMAAVRMRPVLILKYRSLRGILGALFGQLYYRYLYQTQKKT